MTDVLDRMATRLASLMGKGYTGSVVIKLTIYRGGITHVSVNEEYPIDLTPQERKKNSLDSELKV